MFITDRNKYLIVSKVSLLVKNEIQFPAYPNLQGSSSPFHPLIDFICYPSPLHHLPMAALSTLLILVHMSASELCTYYFFYIELYHSRSLIKCQLLIIAFPIYPLKKLATPANRKSPGHFPALLFLEHFSPPYITVMYVLVSCSFCLECKAQGSKNYTYFFYYWIPVTKQCLAYTRSSINIH